MSHPRRTLRAAFVNTFAAATALLVGCGDSVRPCADGGQCQDPVCPTTAPVEGAACGAPSSTYCGYASPNCGGTEDIQARCVDGRWSLQRSSCNPPPPECPIEAPMHDSPCVSSQSGTSCGYGDCYGSPVTTAVCDQSTARWQVLTQSCNPPVPQCPTSVPAQGSSCAGDLAYPGQQCSYDSTTACPGPEAQATCDATTRTWQISIATCNPPPPMCPPSAPTAYTTCFVPNGMCTYATADGCTDTWYCNGEGVWLVSRGDCADPGTDGGDAPDAALPDGG